MKYIKDLYLQGRTIREIAIISGKSKTSVGEEIKKLNIGRTRGPRIDCVKKGHSCLDFDDKFIEYLDGLLISDGCLAAPKGSSKFCHYSQTSVCLDWLNQISNTFKVFGIKSKIKEESRKKGSWQLWTLHYDKLFYFRQRWYDNNVKIIPKNLNFTSPIFLKNWVYGDGTLIKNSTFRFCTDNFTESNIDFLVTGLNSIKDLEFKKLFVGHNKAGMPKYRLTICLKDGLKNFYQLLGECDIKYFTYKWRI